MKVILLIFTCFIQWSVLNQREFFFGNWLYGAERNYNVLTI